MCKNDSEDLYDGIDVGDSLLLENDNDSVNKSKNLNNFGIVDWNESKIKRGKTSLILTKSDGVDLNFWQSIPYLTQNEDKLKNNDNFSSNILSHQGTFSIENHISQPDPIDKTLKSNNSLDINSDFLLDSSSFLTSDLYNFKMDKKYNNDKIFENDADNNVMDSVKFIIRSIFIFDNFIIISNSNNKSDKDTITLVVSGNWTDIKYEVGQIIKVLKCKCCTNSRTNLIMENIEELKKISMEEYFILKRDLNLKVDDTSKSNHLLDNEFEMSLIDIILNNKFYYISNDVNYLIIEDDIITTTSFLKSIQCKNRIFISKRTVDLSFNFLGPAMIIGTAVHHIFQKCILNLREELNRKNNVNKMDNANNFSKNENTSPVNIISVISKILNTFIDKNLLELYKSNIKPEPFKNEVLKHIKSIILFIDRFPCNKLIPEFPVVNLDFGIKGIIDCLVIQAGDKNYTNYVVELKTGKNQTIEHRAQVLMYNLLLSDNKEKWEEDSKQYGDELSHNIPSGKFEPILYYTSNSKSIPVPIKHLEIRELLIRRNIVATTKQIVECKNCENCELSYVETCSVYTMIKNLNKNHFLYEQMEILERGFEYSEEDFFRVEVIDSKMIKSSEKSESSIQDVKQNVFILLKLKDFKSFGDIFDLNANDYYIRNVETEDYNTYFNSNDINLNEGSSVNINVSLSTDSMKFLSKGKIIKFEDNFLLVKLGLNLKLTLKKNLMIFFEKNSLFYTFSMYSLLNIAYKMYLERREPYILPGQANGLEYICEEERDSAESTNGCMSHDDLSLDFADIDLDSDNTKDNKNIGIASGIENPIDIKENINIKSINNNMAYFNNNNKKNIFPRDTSTDIIDYLDLSQSDGDESDDALFTSTPIPDMYKSEFMRLNKAQQNSLIESLNCRSFKIIHGLPGTGKSTLIALLIKILIYYKNKVLLVCFTHMASENLIKKLPGIRVYKAKNSKGTEDIRNTNNSLYKNSSSLKSPSPLNFESYFNSFDLIVGTCFSFKDPIFIERKFDFCIIDEGSQINTVLGLIGISLSNKFVIVGDHLQISPINGCSKSIFEHCLSLDINYSILNIQYRMLRNIMNLSNTLFYGNIMEQSDKARQCREEGGSVEFVDSSSIDFPIFIKSLHKCTILCYFNSQVENIKNILKNNSNDNNQLSNINSDRLTNSTLSINLNIFVTTIDKFQGSEDDSIVVIFDPILNNDCQNCPKRLNVALTRAKRSLTCVGNFNEMVKVPLFKKLLDLF